MSAPATEHLVFDNTANPYLGTGTVPPDLGPGSTPFGPLCSPTMPSAAPKGSFWVLRGGWIDLAVVGTAAGGMSTKLFVPGGAPAGYGNGDGPILFYSGQTPPGTDHRGVGGLAPLPPGAQRHVTWPVPLPVGGTMTTRLIDRTFEGGTTTWHLEADQYALGAGQQIVELAAAFPGTGMVETADLFAAADYGDAQIPAGYVLVPLAASVNCHTGSSESLRTATLAWAVAGTTLATLGNLSRPHRPNNNSIGLYVPPGTAPGPHTAWDPTKIAGLAGDGPSLEYEAQEGDTVVATFIGLLQPAGDALPWALPPLPGPGA